MNDPNTNQNPNKAMDETKKVQLLHGQEIEVSILSDILYTLRPRLFDRNETPKQRIEAVEQAKKEILEHFSNLLHTTTKKAKKDLMAYFNRGCKCVCHKWTQACNDCEARSEIEKHWEMQKRERSESPATLKAQSEEAE